MNHPTNYLDVGTHYFTVETAWHGFFSAFVLSFSGQSLGFLGIGCYVIYLLLISLEALLKSKSLKVALYVPLTTLIQMLGYAVGLIHEVIQKLRGIDPNKKYIDLY